MGTPSETTFVTLPSQTILDGILSRTPQPRTLYHYTNQKGLLGIIGSRRIWATHHQCMNDAQEFVYAKELFRREIARRGDADALLGQMLRQLGGEGFESVNLYVASLSEEPDSLAQWRAYGGQGAGFALGFRTDAIDLPSEFRLVPCIYEEGTQSDVISSLVDAILDRLHQCPREIVDTPQYVRPYVEIFCRTELHALAPALKHPAFAEEREWRIISRGPMMEDAPDEGVSPLDFREGKSMLIPYRRVPLGNLVLTEVVIGPNPNPEQAVRSVRSLLASRGLATCNVRRSEVPYRNW
jgi:Protein of unknown function (DUF2971)